MKVKCLRLTDGNVEPGSTDGWLRVGQEYRVLELDDTLSQGVLLRLAGTAEETPALFPFQLFEVTDGTLPPSWVIATHASSRLLLTPRAWLEPRFWERFFDKDVDAIAIFQRDQETL
jgi:hypothetical protein